MSSIGLLTSILAAGILGFIIAGLRIPTWANFSIYGLYIIGVIPANMYLYQIAKDKKGPEGPHKAQDR